MTNPIRMSRAKKQRKLEKERALQRACHEHNRKVREIETQAMMYRNSMLLMNKRDCDRRPVVGLFGGLL